jgi:septal ring factor EnvC (AmiA/AmiB activator)
MQPKELILPLLFIATGCLASSQALAVEVAPRISDREIIEALTQLRAGQKAMEEKMELRFKAIDARFSSLDSQFSSIDARFSSLDARFTSIDARFDAMDRHIDGLRQTMLALFGAMMALIVALFGYIAWDRRTMVRPLQERLDRIESELARDLELQHEEGSRLTRLLKVLREMAKTDPKLAEVLRNFSLL